MNFLARRSRGHRDLRAGRSHGARHARRSIRGLRRGDSLERELLAGPADRARGIMIRAGPRSAGPVAPGLEENAHLEYEVLLVERRVRMLVELEPLPRMEPERVGRAGEDLPASAQRVEQHLDVAIAFGWLLEAPRVVIDLERLLGVVVPFGL